MFIKYKGKMNTNASRAFSLRMEKDSRFRLTKWRGNLRLLVKVI